MRRILPLALLLSSFGLLSCGGDDDGVSPENPPTVTVTPASATASSLGETVAFSAQLFDGDGAPVPGASFAWSSSNTGVATVDASGTATAVGNGTTTITAQASGVSGTATLQVSQSIASVDVTPDAATVQEAATVQLSATAADAQGAEVTGASFTWASSATEVATVDASGLVTGVAAGTAVIKATAGGVSDSAVVTVPSPTLEPTSDTEIGGTQTVAAVTIPEGVTVTVTSDLILTVTGPVEVAGALMADCHSVVIRGDSTVTVSGTVDNSCAQEPDSAPALEIVGNGTMEVGGQIVSEGDVLISNDPTLDTLELASLLARNAVLVSGSGFASARAAAAGPACRWFFDFVPGRLAAKDGVSGPQGGGVTDGRKGRTMRALCRGNALLSGGAGPAGVLQGQNGGTGGASGKKGEAQTSNESRAGDGGQGGAVYVGSTGTLTVDNMEIRGSRGGDGGAAYNKANQPGDNATAVGGIGGDGGKLRLVGKQGLVLGPRKVDIVFGSGGAGGEAIAIAADGRNGAVQCPAQAGGSALARGGQGGNSSIGLKSVGNVTGLANLDFSGGNGGNGGNAEATAGNGGDGAKGCPDGADGGATTAMGGYGGDARSTFNGASLLPTVSHAGNGGGALFNAGGVGGRGADVMCGPAGNGGNGGAAQGGEGEGGSGPGSNRGADGPRQIAFSDLGDGGDGGNGQPGGKKGLGGAFSFRTREKPAPAPGAPQPARADPEEGTFPDGFDGQDVPCAATVPVSVTVLSDPAGHEPFIAMTTVAQLTVRLLTGGLVDFTGIAPWVDLSGESAQTSSGLDVTLTGMGTVAGYPNIAVLFVGSVMRTADGVPSSLQGQLTVGTNGGLPTGQAAVYTVGAPAAKARE